MAETLAQLLVPQTVTQLFNTLLGVYQSNGFPVQSWQVGGVERTRLMAIATALASLSGQYIPNIAAQGFLDYAVSPSLPLLATELYEITQNPATFTQGSITAMTTATAGPYNYTAGQLIAVFGASGNRYLVTGSGTIAQNAATVLTFQAEFSGAAYNDPSSSGALTLVTPLPGVTLTNPAGNYSPVTHVGSGTGTLNLTLTPVGAHQVTVRLDATSVNGTPTWSYSLDGAPYVSVGTFTSYTIASANIGIALLTGAAGTTSFVNGDTYSFVTPGSWITSQGANIETDAALATRCRNRWSTLGAVPVASYYQLLAQSTPTVGAQVTQVVTVPDGYVNNKLNIVVAGPAGALPASVVSSIQAYINPRAGQGDYPVVVSPGTTNVTLAGTITVYAAQSASAQAAIQTAMTNYVNGVGINGTVRISSIIELIMQVSGVIDAAGITINGAAANLVLGTSSTYFVASLQPLTFTYPSQ